MKKYILLLMAFIGIAHDCEAQFIVNDKQKRKQWQSMEDGPWDFSPGLYYWTLHNGYSGAYMDFNWLNTSIKFKESKSDVKRIMPTGVEAELMQQQKVPKVAEEEEYIKELYNEEVLRQTDRSVDLMYASYSDDFNHMQDQIQDGLAYCLSKSGGKLADYVRELTEENEIICEGIAYIHKTGVGYELENAQRQKAYLDFKDKMKGLVKRVAKLMTVAQTHY